MNKFKRKNLVMVGLFVGLTLVAGLLFYIIRDRQDDIDYDCSNFTSQETAQAYFIREGGSSKKNVDNLDGDRDGVACESKDDEENFKGFTFLKDFAPSDSYANEPTIEDVAEGRAYANPACLDINGDFDLDKAVQVEDGCFSYQPY